MNEDDKPMNGWQLDDWIHNHLKRDSGTSHLPIVFRAECGDFTLLDIVTEDDKTVFLLLEAGK